MFGGPGGPSLLPGLLGGRRGQGQPKNTVDVDGLDSVGGQKTLHAPLSVPVEEDDQEEDSQGVLILIRMSGPVGSVVHVSEHGRLGCLRPQTGTGRGDGPGGGDQMVE